MNILLMQGVSGSGKTTYARKLLGVDDSVLIVSADDHFGSAYEFDPAELPRAHSNCLKKFEWAVQACLHDTVIVDNTNCSAVEIAPYMALAQAHGHDVKIVRMQCELADAIERAEKGPHRTPAKAVLGQWRTLKCYDPPPWWPAVDVVD